MAFAESNYNAVEVDGICMNISEPHLIVLSIPKGNFDAHTSVQLGLHITNNSSTLALPLNLYKNLIPELLTSDGQPLQRQVLKEQEENKSQINLPQQHGWGFKFTSLFSNLVSRFRLSNSVNIDELLVEFTQNRYRYLHLTAKLCWRNNQLQLHFKLGYTWFFEALQPGVYWLRFIESGLTSSKLTSDLKKIGEIGSEQATTQLVNFRILEPIGTDKNALEVDGIRFETVVSEPMLKLPRPQPNLPTFVAVGMRITNNTLIPIRFNLFDSLIPQLVKGDSNTIEPSHFYRIEIMPKNSDFPLVMAGESVLFLPYGKLFWHNDNQFSLQITAADGGIWLFNNLKLGKYQIQFTYHNKNTVKEIYNRELKNMKIMQGLWTGVVFTPYVEFALVLH